MVSTTAVTISVPDFYRNLAAKQIAEATGYSASNMLHMIGPNHYQRDRSDPLFDRNLCAMVAAFRIAIEDRAARLQVDDELVTNWIAVEGGNYKLALHKLIQFCVGVELDPAVSSSARERQEKITGLESTVAALTVERDGHIEALNIRGQAVAAAYRHLSAFCVRVKDDNPLMTVIQDAWNSRNKLVSYGHGKKAFNA